MEGAIALIVWVGQFGPSKIVRCGNGNEVKLLSGGFSQRGIQSAGDSVSRGLSKRGIAQAELFLYIFLIFFIYFSYVYISCITQ
jgi:hypothetical protein